MSKGEYRDSHLSNNRRHTMSAAAANIMSGGGSAGPGGGSKITGGGGGGDIECGPGGGLIWSLGRLERWVGSPDGYNRTDDFVDRLNYRVSGLMMFAFISIIGIRQYVGKPIQCWIPQEFTRGWEEYSENFCWVANTYYAPLADRLPAQIDREHQLIGYYQWAPIILTLQACLFSIPHLIWRFLLSQSEFNLPKLIQSASSLDIIEPESSLVNNKSTNNVRGLNYTARHIDLCIRRCKALRKVINNRHSNHQRQSKCHKFNPLSIISNMSPTMLLINGNYLMPSYCFIKILYLINIIVQLCFMESLFGSSQRLFGIRILIDILSGRQWTHSGNFPRVTFCDLEAKKLGKNHIYTLQCVLPMNMFLEKIFIFLWFWHVCLAIVTISSLTYWTGKMHHRLPWIRRCLRLQNCVKIDSDRTTTARFVKNYLQMDGCFLLAMISTNHGDLVAGVLLAKLWDIYRHHKSTNTALNLDLDTDDEVVKEDNITKQQHHLSGFHDNNSGRGSGGTPGFHNNEATLDTNNNSATIGGTPSENANLDAVLPLSDNKIIHNTFRPTPVHPYIGQHQQHNLQQQQLTNNNHNINEFWNDDVV